MRAFLLSLPAVLGFATLLLALAVWFVGPLIPLGGEPRWLDPWETRLTVIAVLVALWGLVVLIGWLLRRRRNAKLVEELSAPDPRAERMSAEAEELRAKFAAAMQDLRKLTFRGRFGGRRYLYELPWYVFIGPPASGKTTALLNADLGDPLKRGERIAVEGAGGTANCDWMFTDDAVFLDTAGRYVTQDSDAEVDRSAWTAFLDLVVKHRPEEALNGVIVAISIEELASGDPARISAHAQAVRRGVQEIMAKMQARTPVYVMFTKMDLLKGFNEFFQGLDREGREQVWGVTFPHDPAADPARQAEDAVAQAAPEFERLLERLGEKQFERVEAEADLGVRADVFGFPSQFSTLKPVVVRFLEEAFRPDRYSEPMLLRGFHFTSATQQGQPIDRLIASLSREFGIERRATPFLSGGSGRAYFLKGLLKDVVFPEAGLASGARRRRAVLSAGRWAAILALVALPVGLGLAWSRVEASMRAESAALVEAMAAYEAELAALTGTEIPREEEAARAGEPPVFDPARVADDRVELALVPLSHLAEARARLAEAKPPLPLNGLGLADLETLRRQADMAYFKAVDDLFRTRVLHGLEGRMDALIDAPAELHETLKTYLMVGGRASRADVDPVFVRAQVRDLWRARMTEEEAGRLIPALMPHLDGMLEGMERGLIRSRSLNETKLEQVRGIAAEARPAERAYGILKARVAAIGLPDWTVRDAPRGRAAEGVLIRASGEDVFAPIPALYTYRGYWEGARGLFDAAVDEALAEKWVLASRQDAADPTAIERREAETRIRDLYATDYAAAWQGFLDDLRIAPFADAAQAAQILRVLSSLDSPLRNVLTEAARQTHLDRPPETATGQAGGVLDTARAAGVASRATSAAGRLERAAGVAGAGDAGPTVAERVSEDFSSLRDFVGSADQGSPLAELVNRLAELREVVSAIEGRRASLDDLVGNPVVASVQNTADAGPPFLRRMASEMAQTFETTVAGGLRASLNERWRAEVAPFCQQRLAGRYPFGDGQDAALGDVAEVLGPGGLVDAFFRRNLAGMVDTQALEWRWQDLGLALGIPVETLRFFQTAAELKDAFFPGGAQVAGFAFGVRPEAFDPEVSAMAMAVGGEAASFERDAPKPAQLAWPGPVPDQGAIVTMNVLGGGRDISGAPLPPTEAEQAQIGAWGLFRLLDRSGFGRLGSGERVRVRLRAGGRSVTAILSMSSPTNPLALRRAMGSFRCPASL